MCKRVDKLTFFFPRLPYLFAILETTLVRFIIKFFCGVLVQSFVVKQFKNKSRIRMIIIPYIKTVFWPVEDFSIDPPNFFCYLCEEKRSEFHRVLKWLLGLKIFSSLYRESVYESRPKKTRQIQGSVGLNISPYKKVRRCISVDGKVQGLLCQRRGTWVLQRWTSLSIPDRPSWPIWLVMMGSNSKNMPISISPIKGLFYYLHSRLFYVMWSV